MIVTFVVDGIQLYTMTTRLFLLNADDNNAQGTMFYKLKSIGLGYSGFPELYNICFAAPIWNPMV
jgi:hypothetical protein